MRTRTNLIIAIISVLVVVAIGLIAYDQKESSVPSGKYDTFAQCLTDKGVKMYGAYWCSHCADQKALFGDSFDKINYVECAQPGNPNQMTQQCKDAGVEGYPTWIFSDGSKLSGTQELSVLAEKGQCELPNTNS